MHVERKAQNAGQTLQLNVVNLTVLFSIDSGAQISKPKIATIYYKFA